MELTGGSGHEQGLAGGEHVAAQVALQQHLPLEAEEGAEPPPGTRWRVRKVPGGSVSVVSDSSRVIDGRVAATDVHLCRFGATRSGGAACTLTH